MAEESFRDIFVKVAKGRRQLIKDMRQMEQRRLDLINENQDLSDSGDLIYDAIQNVIESPVPDLIEYSLLKAELAITLADLEENEQAIQHVRALQEEQEEILASLKRQMRDLNKKNKMYGRVLQFRKAG